MSGLPRLLESRSWQKAGALRVSSPAGNLPLTVDVTTVRASLSLHGMNRPVTNSCRFKVHP